MASPMSVIRSGPEARIKWLEEQFDLLKARVDLMQKKLDRLDAQAQQTGPSRPNGGGGPPPGSFWATTDGSIDGKTGTGPGVGTGAVQRVNDDLEFEEVDSGLTLINGWSDATESDAWVRVVPLGGDVYVIAEEECPE